MVLLIDNFDSFTFNLVDYLYRSGVECRVVRNNVNPVEIDFTGITGLMLSPGPETPSKSGFLFSYIEKFHKMLPILGICLGHQAIGEYFGATLVKAIKPMHGKISNIIIDKDPLFDSMPGKIDVVRYNSLVVKDLPETLKCIATTSEGEIMALRHNHLPIWGLQFHPEAALTQGGLIMLKNWISYNKIE